MKSKRLLSVLLCMVLLIGTVAGTVALPAADAADGIGNVPFRSPAITANVGDTIDLTKYGVEFEEGVTTSEGLTWWDASASTTVPYTAPAILANVGETVDLSDWAVEFENGIATDAANISWQKKLDENTVTFSMPAILTDAGTALDFADYPVEMTEGTIVSGSKLTWTQTKVSTDPLITYVSPAIPANVGDVIDLTKYAVEFEDGVVTRPASITWTDAEGAAATSFTPAVAGVTALTATAGDISKTIYVVAKNAEDTKYVLYRNDFSSAEDVAQLDKSSMGSSAATAVYAEGGYLSHNRNGATTATYQSMLFTPDWLCDFGAYRLETSVSVSAYGNTGRYFSFLTGGSNTAYGGPYYVIGHTKAGKWFSAKNADAKKWGLTNYTAGDKTGAFTMNVDTYYTYALEYDGTNLTSYIDGTKITAFTMPDPDPIAVGRPGIGFHGIDASADYFEVALLDNSIKTATYVDTYANYTPAAKGVTAFDVTDGTTTKTIYVVAKDAADTEYVLYENDFAETTDMDDLESVLNGAGTATIADGKFSFVRTSSDSANNRAYMLPDWLCAFGDYTLEMNAIVNAQASTFRYIGFLYHGQTGTDARPYVITAFDRKKQIIWGDRSTAESGWNPNWYTAKSNAYTLPALGTAATYKITVAGDELTVFFDGTQVASKTLPDTAPEMGRPGIMTAGVDFDIDYYKVTLTEPEKTEAATTFTPVAAGVTEFVATAADGTTKSVYVVAKESGDTEYVLYENDFDTAASLNDVIRVWGGDADYNPYVVSDGHLTVTRVSNNSGNTTIGFPLWLSTFGDYTIEASMAITAQKNDSRYYGIAFRGNPNMSSPVPYYVSIYKRNGIWQGQRRVSVTDSSWDNAWDKWAGPSVTGAFTAAALGTYATHTVEVKGDTALAYYNGTQVGTYTPTDVRDTGFVGLFFTAIDAKIDYFKVTLPALKTVEEQITTFTPTEAGVKQLKVKDAEGNEKNIYIIAKEADDTEYVLYENEFENAYDVNSLTVVGGAATMKAADGAMTLTTTGAYVRLPAWLGDFGDYKLDMVATTTTYGDATDWIAFFGRGQNEDSAFNSYVSRVRHTNNSWDSTGYYYYDAAGTFNRYSWGGHTAISTGSKHTYSFQMLDDLLTMKQDGTYVFYAEEEKVLRVGHIGFAVSNVTLSVDSIRVTLEDTQKPNAPVSATFTPEAGLPYGTIAGSLSVQLDTAGDAAVDVAYYWGDGEGKLAGYGAFDEILVSGKSTVTDIIPAGTVVPAGAKELRVYTANAAGESETCAVIPLPLSVRAMTAAEEVMSFQIASDTHVLPKGSSVNETYNTEHFADLLQDIARLDPDSVGLFHGGDIVDNGKITEYENFQEIWNTYSNGLALEGIIGNHEYWNTATHADTVNNFANYTGIPITPETAYYTKNIGGYDFFFLNSYIIDPSGGNHNISTLGDTQLAWLDAGLAAVDADTPAFVFHHQKFNQIADADALKAILAKYPNAIFLTSHTHTDMNTAGIFEYENEGMCKTANTSSVSYSVYTHYNPSGENTHARSQAYYVEIYEDRVLFRGMDVMTNEWLPSAQFVFWYGDVDTYPTDANLYPAASGDCEEFAFDASTLTAVGDDGFTDADTATVADLEGKFNFYYDREGAYYLERDLFDNTDTTDDYNPSGTATGWSKWVPSGAWLQRTTGKTSGEIFRKIDSLVPLNSAGEEIVVTSFETTYDVKFAGTAGGVILGFRQQTPGRFTTGYYNIAKDMGFVSIGKNGITIAAGSDIVAQSDGDSTTDMYNHYETAFATTLPSTVSVKVRVVDTTCEVWIYEYGTENVLYNYSEKIPYMNAGTLAYAVSTIGHSVGNIQLAALNNMSFPVDVNAQGGHMNGAIEVVGMDETDDGYKYTLEVTPDAGYEMKAGSFYVVDTHGNYAVPERIGFQSADTQAVQYTVTVTGEGSVFAVFYQPTDSEPNIGWLGTSVHTEKEGLRFIHRVNITGDAENGYYIDLGGDAAAKVKDFGLLLASSYVVTDSADLTVETAANSTYVREYSIIGGTEGWTATNRYYDIADTYIDIAVQVNGIAKGGGAHDDLMSRVYVVLEDGTVVYGDVAVRSYAEAGGLYQIATMAELDAENAVIYHGRTAVSGTARTMPAYGGTGFTISGNLTGSVKVSLNHSEYACVLNVVVDDDAENVRSIWLEAGNATVTVAQNLPVGTHTVQVTRGTSNYGTLTVKDITYSGTLTTPTVNPLQIEFLGDSITAAGGGDFDYGDGSNLAKSRAHNTYLGYAAQTARAIGADMSMVARSGYTTARLRNLFNDSSWDFAANHKDIVVINLGTNDFGYAAKPAPSEIEGFTDVCNGLIDDVRAAYGEDTYIIWAYGMMFDKDKDFLDELTGTYRTENGDEKVLFCDLSAAKNNDGNSSHPSQAGHDAAAKLLIKFIEENCVSVLN